MRDVPFGAVVVQNGSVVAMTGESEHLDQDVTKHAEMKAISDISHALWRRDLSDRTIYSTTEPCPMGTRAIFHSCIKRVMIGMSRDNLPHLFRTRNIRLCDLAKDWHYEHVVVGYMLKYGFIEAFLSYKKVIPLRA